MNEEFVKRSRALAAAILPATLVGTLLVTGCTAGTDVNCAPEGSVSKAITVEGKFGEDVTLTSETPIQATEFERSVLEQGDGEKVEADELVVTNLTAINGDTGEVISTESAQMQNSAETMAPWVADSLTCSSIGDRVVAVSPVVDIVGEGNEASFGMEAGGTIVLVLDLMEKAPTPPGTLEPGDLLEGPDGKAKDAPAGFPTVTVDADGSPIITMPEGVVPPTELSVATLITGTGEKVQPGDRVYVNYRGVIWRTGEEFDSSWSRGEATSFLTTEVIEGFKVALEGQTVGSQVIAVVPANDGGYGSDWLVSQGYEAEDVMVFVLDILGTAHAG
ncbi:FKBP-type peptidyl-prolyl cis-trans isomerase [Leucobacter sp. Z1108]|uniref:FKBP-type peptidyl-prolyl cis-trans isomerase n=1 Tax=Leucobacter sp. Z1108 TaxID=3439066 RepID=UPI003F5098D7